MNMNTTNRRSCWTLSSCFTCVLLLAILSPLASAQWPGWGGPNRNFTVDVKGLSTQWSTDGPKQVWSRDLGPGYSAIAVDQGRLYTMYRKGKKEVVVALDAETGKTVWEHQYDAFLLKDMDPQFGEGPNATPLVHDGRVYTLGIAGRLECVDQNTGKRIWSSGLVQKLKATVPGFGFSSSPIAYKDTLIVSAGGKNAGVAAFDLKTGKLRWRKHDFVDTYSSPLVINVDGEDQLVLLVDREVVGLDPTTGDLKWRFPHENQWKTNISMPVWGDDGLLYVTSGGTAGSRALKLTRSADVTSVEEVWTNKKVKIGQGNVIRIGDQVYGSGGGSGPGRHPHCHRLPLLDHIRFQHDRRSQGLRGRRIQNRRTRNRNTPRSHNRHGRRPGRQLGRIPKHVRPAGRYIWRGKYRGHRVCAFPPPPVIARNVVTWQSSYVESCQAAYWRCKDRL